MTRIVTSLVLIPTVVWLVLGAPAWAFIAALVVVGSLALREVVQIGTNAVASAVLGAIYIGGAWFCAFKLREISPHWLMFAFILCWAGDTAALYIGKNFGKHKLAPAISPAKTWEGAIASVMGGVFIGAIYLRYFLPAASLRTVLIAGIAGNVAGQIGDLVESKYKRSVGVKDSGSSLPGHGGWLDRIDSSLLAAPVVYALVLLAA
ncbi:MAG TPA: phosphatidate cytidylyltransferase [Bryobacteraceae bacterium]|nr:phosphatidate cytidylyltransferase [Bryobacteraceae bacterium]